MYHINQPSVILYHLCTCHTGLCLCLPQCLYQAQKCHPFMDQCCPGMTCLNLIRGFCVYGREMCICQPQRLYDSFYRTGRGAPNPDWGGSQHSPGPVWGPPQRSSAWGVSKRTSSPTWPVSRRSRPKWTVGLLWYQQRFHMYILWVLQLCCLLITDDI